MGNLFITTSTKKWAKTWWVFNKKSLSSVTVIEHCFKWKNYTEKIRKCIKYLKVSLLRLVEPLYSTTETASYLG